MSSRARGFSCVASLLQAHSLLKLLHPGLVVSVLAARSALAFWLPCIRTLPAFAIKQRSLNFDKHVHFNFDPRLKGNSKSQRHNFLCGLGRGCVQFGRVCDLCLLWAHRCWRSLPSNQDLDHFNTRLGKAIWRSWCQPSLQHCQACEAGQPVCCCCLSAQQAAGCGDPGCTMGPAIRLAAMALPFCFTGSAKSAVF